MGNEHFCDTTERASKDYFVHIKGDFQKNHRSGWRNPLIPQPCIRGLPCSFTCNTYHGFSCDASREVSPVHEVDRFGRPPNLLTMYPRSIRTYTWVALWKNGGPWRMEQNRSKPVPSISNQAHLKRTPMTVYCKCISVYLLCTFLLLGWK